ncbi:MAG: MoaD/ThiS family protein [Elusimicrobiota bacterium]|jgi:adenylyltransferase/sulfurtransferase|nr:MoaD/ThiS family protein [Elusimicrobiota bacterium]
MAIEILIPSALRGFTDAKSAAAVEAKTVGEAIANFAKDYPDIKKHLYDDNGQLRAFINIFVGENNIKNLNGLETPLADGQTIMIVPAIAGGLE